MQLLIGVNVILTGLLAGALFADYRRELSHHLRHEEGALLAEAETIASALPALERTERDSIQRLLDSIVADQTAANAPRHRVVVQWNNHVIEPRTNSDDTVGLDHLIRRPEGRSESHAAWETKDHVVGMCQKGGFTVHVAEPLAALKREIGYETLERLMVLVAAGLVAMGVVDFILLRALVRPIEQLSRTVEEIGNGKLGVQIAAYRTAELAALAGSINRMSTMLAAHDREVHQQMSKARRLQQHLLPAWPTIVGLNTERRFLPATEVTGDFHEAYPLPNGEWLFCIADVTGHGIPAAMTAAMLKVLFHQAAKDSLEPDKILHQLNKDFGAVVMPGDFATMLVVRWQPELRQISYANGGHEPGLLLRQDGDLQLLESDGFMVGAVPEATWTSHCAPFCPGDRLFMYTDGAVEAFNPRREMFSRDRLIAAFSACRSVSLPDAIAQIIKSLDDFREGRPFGDDVTLLLMEFAQSSV